MADSPSQGPQGFATTHWSLVLAAQEREQTGNADNSQPGSSRPDVEQRARARDALEALCQTYWRPLYAFVCNRGYSSHEAQDLTQSFFARTLESNGLSTANPKKGRFRSYLLGAMKHFLANEWHRARTIKRGGSQTIIELDALDSAARQAMEPQVSPDLDASFDRAWALESIDRAMAALHEESLSNGKERVFEVLKGSLTGIEPPRGETAAQLGMTTGAVKVAVHRLRQRYRELLRAEIAKTVGDPTDVDDEMRHLVAALRTA